MKYSPQILHSATETGKWIVTNNLHRDKEPHTGRIIRCMAVDDEPHAVELISRHINNTPFLELVHATTHPVEILERAAKDPFHLLFIDVEMPLLNGFDLVSMLLGTCYFVLCSAHRKYALKGYEHDVSDYLLKPVTYNRFVKAVEKVKQQIAIKHSPGEHKKNHPDQDYLLLKGDRKHRHLKIYFDEIDYVEGAGHYMTLFVKGNRKTILITMKELLAQLPEHRFMRIHNSYIVPLNRITYIDFDELGLQNVTYPIPLSSKYREVLLKILKG